MRPASAGCALLVLLASLAAGLPARADPPCAPPAPEVQALRDVVQADAGQPGDAADCMASARVLAPARDGGYAWGLLDPLGQPGASDLDDWYAADLAAVFGAGQLVRVALAGDIVPYGVLPLPPLPQVAVTAQLLAPDGSVAATLSGCGGPFDVVPQPGVWRVHVFHLALPGDVPCIPPGGNPPAPAPPPGAQDYGIYLGCHPFCALP
jgi:hypothetical protein